MATKTRSARTPAERLAEAMENQNRLFSKQQRIDAARYRAEHGGSEPEVIPLGIKIPNSWEGFHTFYNFMFSDQGFSLAPHLIPLVKGACDTRIPKLLVIAGPGSGKSALLSVGYPAFQIAQDPAITILGISAGEALIQGFMGAIQGWIEHSMLWRSLFPEVTPNKDMGWSTERGLFVQGHNGGDPDATYFGCGLTSKALTGKHARLIDCDDLHDKENSQTGDSCMRVREVYYRQILGRADPRGARYIIAGRRWHEEDVYGHLLASGEWVVLNLPAIRESSSHLFWDIYIPEGMTCVFNDPEEKEKDRRLLELLDAEASGNESALAAAMAEQLKHPHAEGQLVDSNGDAM